MFILYVRPAFEDVSAFKQARVLFLARLYMQELRRVSNMSDYGSIRLNNA